MSVLCSTVAVALPTVGRQGISGPLATHVESCDACTTEVALYDDLYAGMVGLRESYELAPQGLTRSVMARLGPVAVPDLEDRWDPRVPVAAAAAFATAAAGTAVLVRIYRHRAA